MSKNKKWSTEEKRTKSDVLYACLFVSRNKDNVSVEDFKERRVAFLTTKRPEELNKKFQSFRKEGLPGEMSRFYYSVNAISNQKTFKALLKHMIDEEFNLAAIMSIATSHGMKSENAATKRWMFDVDGTKEQLDAFLVDLQHYMQNNPSGKVDQFEVHKTPNGFAVIVESGFYGVEKLLEKYKDFVELKRNGQLCVAWGKTED